MARTPRFMTVKDTARVSANMIRVTFAGPEVAGVRRGSAGANCKLQLPEPGQSLDAFMAQVHSGPKPVTRTYTIAHVRDDPWEVDIDFVDHGDRGPASAWARAAGPGAFLNMMGPSEDKITDFAADYWIVGADMAALPMAAAYLNKMPADAKGLALLEILSAEDRQDFPIPAGFEVHWLINPDPSQTSYQQLNVLAQRPFPTGKVKTCIAGETGTIRAWKQLIEREHNLPREDVYISGYWKIGLKEDEHQAMRRKEKASAVVTQAAAQLASLDRG